jgi:hypothetical protein|tara:strand:+ start:222 stop:989 length:768 start_codon:yes stop_codon:yes gene_type:complete
MVFTDSAETKQPEQSSEAQGQETPSQESYLQKLVETKGENWKDPEVLAKGKLEADGYIKNLEDQLGQMREDLKKQEYQAQILDQLQNKATESTAVKPEVSNNNGSTTEGNTNPTLSEEDLKSLVEQTLNQREIDSTVSNNLKLVDEELEKSYGTEAQAKIQEKAQELGMSMERIKEIAAESPNAFFALIGEPKKTFSPMVQGSVRTEGVNMQASTERDWSYYQKLRRENRNLYYTPKIQQQLMEDKSRLGSKFGI